MENTYQIPSRKGAALEEKKIFWRKVIADQVASGMKMTKFCYLHELSVSTLKQWKYKLQLNDKRVELVNGPKKDNTGISFTPLQVELSNFTKDGKEETSLGQIKIGFKNGHSITIDATEMEKTLSLMITQISLLP